MTDVKSIALRELTPAPDNPRRSPGNVAELAASMKTAGVLEPLIACPNGKSYEVIIGSRRLAAAKEAGLTELPVIVRDLDAKDRAEAMLIENLQRDDLLPTEEGAAYARLLEVGGYTQRTLAQRIGVSQAVISKRMGLLALPEKVQGEIDSGRITLSDAEELTKLAAFPERLERVIGAKRSSWMSLAEAAKRELEEAAREQKREEAIAKVKAGKVPYVELSDLGGLPEGVEYVGDEEGWRSGLSIPLKTHAKEPCHAVVVGSYRADVQPVCTDPSRHPEAKQDDDEDGGTDWRTGRAKDNERDKALTAARKERVRVIAECLPGRHTREEALTILVHSTIRNAGQTPKQAACKALGIEAPKGGEYGGRDFQGALFTYVAESEANMLRAALALGLAWMEESLGTWSGWEHAEEHFAFLKAYGYKVTPAEREQLKKGGRS